MAIVDEEPPAAARMLIGFVNSVEWQTDEESWDTPRALEAWFGERVGEVARELTEDDLVLARALREGLREVLLAHAGHEPLAASITALNALLVQVPLRLRFDEDGGVRISPADGSFLAPVLVAVDELRSDGGWERLKACSRDSCRWAYWDASRNRSSRWCTMAGCGNYVKMRRRNSSDAAASDVLATRGRAPRMLDVAARAGVSAKTVSNIVTGAAAVSPTTRERVEAAIEELGYRPNLAARALRTGRRDVGDAASPASSPQRT